MADSTSPLFVGNGNRRPAISLPSGRVIESEYEAVSEVQPEVLVYHSADYDHDYHILQFELMRVIDLYNTRNGTVRTGAYKVDPTSVDGFAPDPDRDPSAVVQLSKYHSADVDRNGKFSLGELLRVIELYNYREGPDRTGEYHVWVAAEGGVSEDGFASGPPRV